MQAQQKETKMADLSSYYVKVIEKTFQEPLFKGSGCIDSRGKVAPLKLYDALVAKLLNQCANTILTQKGWKIYAFGYKRYRMHDMNGKELTSGIFIRSNEEEEKTCSLETLKATYDEVIHELQSGWKPAVLRDYPDIYFKENHQEYDLYVKDKPSFIENESKLIYSLLRRFRINGSCYNKWKTPQGDYELSSRMYLWVKKDQKNFHEITGFHE